MKSLSRETLHRWKAEGRDFALIDVLSPGSFHDKHIPGSMNVPGDDPAFVDKVEQVAHGRDKPVVVYCASLDCEASPRAARALDDAGFAHVFDYEAGIADWEGAGLPIDGTSASRAS